MLAGKRKKLDDSLKKNEAVFLYSSWSV